MSEPRPALDWGLGNYERTAEQLMPAAEAVVEAGAPQAEERVVDLGCGTGNVRSPTRQPTCCSPSSR
jgi:trans-aconitate methyltransferase